MFRVEEFMGKKVLKSSFIDDDSVVAFFTTRELPLKSGERDDLIEEVEQNKKLVCEELNISDENLIIPQQTHSSNVQIVNCKQETVNGIHSPLTSHFSPFENTDALITNQREVALVLNFADCVPIIFYDPIKKVVASAHAGWRGTVAKIGVKTVESMVENFSCNPEDIIALIGPSIGKCCFEVKENVLQELKASLPLTPTLCSIGRGSIEDTFDDSHVDLKLINKFQLLASGIKKIDVCEYCTSCSNELFFSYRKEKGNTARHSAVIMIK